MARPKNPVPTTRVNIWLPDPIVERLDEYAHMNGITRTTAVQILTTKGLQMEEQVEQTRKLIKSGQLSEMIEIIKKAEGETGKKTGKFAGQQALDLEDDLWEV